MKRYPLFYALCLLMTGLALLSSCNASKEVVYFQTCLIYPTFRDSWDNRRLPEG